MTRKIIPISIKEKEVLRHLDKQENKSQYIRSLIKRDMQKGDIPEDIKKYIKEYIQSNYQITSIMNNNDLSNFRDDLNKIFNI